ncbi:hypothetical protein P3T27_006581 [Kitasatospora sp. MAA19]|nr:hypothetical protein [Kitasatospora sp. MAA19]
MRAGASAALLQRARDRLRVCGPTGATRRCGPSRAGRARCSRRRRPRCREYLRRHAMLHAEQQTADRQRVAQQRVEADARRACSAGAGRGRGGGPPDAAVRSIRTVIRECVDLALTALRAARTNRSLPAQPTRLGCRPLAHDRRPRRRRPLAAGPRARRGPGARFGQRYEQAVVFVGDPRRQRRDGSPTPGRRGAGGRAGRLRTPAQLRAGIGGSGTPSEGSVVGRPKRAVAAGAVAGHLAEYLNALCARSGKTYAQMAAETSPSVSVATLSRAASGKRRPQLEVVRAFVRACSSAPTVANAARFSSVGSASQSASAVYQRRWSSS